MVKKNKLITASNFKDFDWNKAKLFYHIAKCGSFTKAARLSDIDQSVLTRQIQILETQVGCPLLVRKAGGVSLTRKGEELLAQVAPFFLGMRGFCGNNYIEIGGERKRKIRIVTTTALAAYVINGLVLEYNKTHPHLVFEIIGEDHIIDVILNDADIAIRPLDPRVKGAEKGREAHYDYLFGLEKKLFASPEYLERHGEPKTLEELKSHHIIAMANPEQHPYGDVNWILRLGMPEGEFHKPIYTANSLECRVEACEKGIGIIGSYEEFSIIKKAHLKNILPNIKCEPLNSYFMYPDYLKEDHEIITLKNYLQEKTNF